MKTAKNIDPIPTTNAHKLTLCDKQPLALIINPPNSIDIQIRRKTKGPLTLDRLTYTYRSIDAQHPLGEENFWWSRYDPQRPRTRPQVTALLDALGFDGEKAVNYVVPDRDSGVPYMNYTRATRIDKASIHTAILTTTETGRDVLVVTRSRNEEHYNPVDGVYLDTDESNARKLVIRWLEDAPGRYWWPDLRACNTQPATTWTINRIRESLSELGFNPEVIDLAFAEVLLRKVG
jgi:hypothetical protein